MTAKRGWMAYEIQSTSVVNPRALTGGRVSVAVKGWWELPVFFWKFLYPDPSMSVLYDGGRLSVRREFSSREPMLGLQGSVMLYRARRLSIIEQSAVTWNSGSRHELVVTGDLRQVFYAREVEFTIPRAQSVLVEDGLFATAELAAGDFA